MAKIPFTQEMKDMGYTIAIPNMSPIHFNIMKRIFINHGFRPVLLENSSPSVIREGLKYVHNDMCYPCLLVIGQIIDAINRGIVDKDHTAVIISQTGGGCRASNYYFLLIKALERAGLGNIPVISANLQGMNANPGFQITLPMLVQAFTALVYGDLLMLLSNQVKPYEINKGDTDRVIDKWTDILGDCYEKNKGYFWGNMKKKLFQIADDFAAVPVKRVPKVKVGVVGEIYMKYSRLGNSNLQGFLEDEGAEVMLPPMMGFVLYCFANGIKDEEYYGGRAKYAFLMKHIGMPLLTIVEKWTDQAIERYPEFRTAATFKELEKYAERFIDRGCKMGEGWLLTAEMAELIEKGYDNIVCTQPFGCLPNHICGKGMIRPLKEAYPESNIVPIDYDPSATKVNQENRIKLMLAVAREKLEVSEVK